MPETLLAPQSPVTEQHTESVQIPPSEEVVEHARLMEGVNAELVMKETDRATIEAQMKQGLEEKGLFGFVNNFEAHLPGGWDDTNLQKYPELADKSKFYDDEEDEDDLLPAQESRPNVRDRIYHSDRYLKATNASMQADIVHVIAHTQEVDPEKLEALRQTYVQKRETSPSRIADEERAAYLTYTLPIYRGLRELGYSHYDLWA